MKNLMVVLALVCFTAFAASAQTAQTSAAPAAKETVVKSDDAAAPAMKSCCKGKKAKACGPMDKAEARACCKGKDAKACNHDEKGKAHSDSKDAGQAKGADSK